MIKSKPMETPDQGGLNRQDRHEKEQKRREEEREQEEEGHHNSSSSEGEGKIICRSDGNGAEGATSPPLPPLPNTVPAVASAAASAPEWQGLARSAQISWAMALGPRLCCRTR